MSKAKSQWDFGELFPAQQVRRVFTVSELTSRVRRALEKEISSLWVTGEVTNLRLQSSGHIYFTLKDANSQIACVLFRTETVASRGLLQDGHKVVLSGEITVYETRGQYQLIVHAVELQGVGALQLAFERLKLKLQAEGLFAPERKRPLPRYARRLGVVTSASGAALRDVLHVIGRRQPGLEIILAPCRVQGEGAGAEIAAAIRLLNKFHETLRAQAGRLSGFGAAHPGIDLILVTRGGGSLEDLWAFNEEVVARAIFDSALPVVSAVGHEIDFTISDFVADLRAATPSAAGEIITEGAFACRQFLADAFSRFAQLVRRRLVQDRGELRELAARLRRMHPRRVLQEKLQYLDDLQTALVRCTRLDLRERRNAWQNLQHRLFRSRPSALLAQRRQWLRGVAQRLGARAHYARKERTNELKDLDNRLRLLSPLNVLARGYSITTDAATGRVIRDSAEVRVGQKLKTKLQQGEVQSVVEGGSG